MLSSGHSLSRRGVCGRGCRVPRLTLLTLLIMMTPPATPTPPTTRLRGTPLILAFAIAGVSDLLSMWLQFAPPLQWMLDVATAGLLFLVLGRQWLILPALIAEAIPGLAVLPFWVLVVGSIAAWGRVAGPSRS